VSKKWHLICESDYINSLMILRRDFLAVLAAGSENSLPIDMLRKKQSFLLAVRGRIAILSLTTPIA
jgi:hypothetical protein